MSATAAQRRQRLCYALTFTGQRADQPRRYLADRKRFPLLEPKTVDLSKALLFYARPSTYRFIARHPELRGVVRPLPVDPSTVAAA
jgi:hypothetical protein